MKKTQKKKNEKLRGFFWFAALLLMGFFLGFETGILGIFKYIVICLFSGMLTAYLGFNLVHDIKISTKIYTKILWGLGTVICGAFFILFSAQIVLDVPYFFKPEDEIISNWTVERVSRRRTKYYKLKGVDRSGTQHTFSIDSPIDGFRYESAEDSLQIKYLPNTNIVLNISTK